MAFKKGGLNRNRGLESLLPDILGIGSSKKKKTSAKLKKKASTEKAETKPTVTTSKKRAQSASKAKTKKVMKTATTVKSKKTTKVSNKTAQPNNIAKVTKKSKTTKAKQLVQKPVKIVKKLRANEGVEKTPQAPSKAAIMSEDSINFRRMAIKNTSKVEDTITVDKENTDAEDVSGYIKDLKTALSSLTKSQREAIRRKKAEEASKKTEHLSEVMAGFNIKEELQCAVNQSKENIISKSVMHEKDIDEHEVYQGNEHDSYMQESNYMQENTTEERSALLTAELNIDDFSFNKEVNNTERILSNMNINSHNSRAIFSDHSDSVEDENDLNSNTELLNLLNQRDENFGVNKDTENINIDAEDKEFYEELTYWDVNKLEPSRFQPRKDVDETDLESLSESIRAQGVLQPLVVRRTQMGRAEIIAGERRWRASRLANLQEVPVIVKDVSDEACMAISLIENIQREDLNPIDAALALERLVNEFDLTHARIAKAIGKSRTSITNALRLLTLPMEVKISLERGDLEVGHAKVLLGLPSASQAPAARAVIAKGLSVRETEQMVARMLNERSPNAVRKEKAIDPDINRLQVNLSETIGAKVNINHNRKGGGKIVIQYSTLDELDGILEHIN